MNSAFSRTLSTTAKTSLKWAGATEAEVLIANPGIRGQNTLQAIKTFEADAEEQYGPRAAVLKIQGTKLHKSTKDPNETMDVVTISVHTESGTRLVSGHAREDGTLTKHETRAGTK